MGLTETARGAPVGADFTGRGGTAREREVPGEAGADAGLANQDGWSGKRKREANTGSVLNQKYRM